MGSHKYFVAINLVVCKVNGGLHKINIKCNDMTVLKYLAISQEVTRRITIVPKLVKYDFLLVNSCGDKIQTLNALKLTKLLPTNGSVNLLPIKLNDNFLPML